MMFVLWLVELYQGYHIRLPFRFTKGCFRAPWDIYQEVAIASLYADLLLAFEEFATLISMVAPQFSVLLIVKETSSFPTSLPAYVGVIDPRGEHAATATLINQGNF